jgi:hypothetical protein
MTLAQDFVNIINKHQVDYMETEKMNYEQFKAYLKKNQIEQVVKL